MPNTTGNPPATMAEAWRSFYGPLLALQNLSPTETQYIETRRAFYAGGQIAFEIVAHLSDVLTEDQARAALDAMAAEFRQFHEDLRRGRP